MKKIFKRFVQVILFVLLLIPTVFIQLPYECINWIMTGEPKMDDPWAFKILNL